MHSNPILTILEIACLVELSYDATGVEWFAFDYEQSKFILKPAVSGVTRNRADGTEVIEGGHKKIRPIYCEEFEDRGMSRIFDERA